MNGRLRSARKAAAVSRRFPNANSRQWDSAATLGFTLVEVMVAVFFGAMILVAATSFIFSMGELWGRGAPEAFPDFWNNPSRRLL